MNLIIIDYGAGNTANVKNAFEKLGVQAVISDSEIAWKKTDGLILPGVGAFGSAMKRLGNRSNTIRQLILERKPFLGICLGMQLLLDKSEESKGVKGLSIVPGEVKRFKVDLPIPQIGWNKVECPNSPLFDGVEDFYAYFVHSYYCKPKDSAVIAATTNYGIAFASAFCKGNVFATQFHPEKSGEMGLRVLQNFIQEVKR